MKETTLFQYFRSEGEKYFRAKAYKDALVHWQKAFEIHPDPELEEKIRQCQQILKEVEQILEKAQWLALEGKWKEAIEELHQGLALSPEDHTLLVHIALFQQNWEKYIKLWREVKKCQWQCRLLKAFKLCEELSHFSPKDRRIGYQILSLFLQGGVLLLLVFFGICYLL